MATNDRERYLLGREVSAAAKTAETVNRVAELRSVLAAGVGRHARVDLRLLRKQAWTPPLDLGDLAEPRRAPSWQDFDPRPRTFGHQRRLEQARAEFDEAVRLHEVEEAARQRQVADLRARHAGNREWTEKLTLEHNRDLDALGRELVRRVPEAVERYLRLVLAVVPFPSGFPRYAEVAFHPDIEVAAVRVELPPRDVVPSARAFTFDRGEDRELAEPRPAAELGELYGSVVGQVALLVARDLFDADEHLTEVRVDGHVRVTGNPCLISLVAERTVLAKIDLREIPAAVCLRRLGAAVSPAPYDYAPIGPPDAKRMLSG